MKINLRIIILHICMFLLLLYPFNSSIALTLYHSSNMVLVTTVMGLIGLFLFSKKSKFSRKTVLIMALVLVFILMTAINNGYWKYGMELRVILYVIYILLFFVIYLCPENAKVFCNILKIFFAEHIIATFIGLFFKDFYKNTVLTFVCSNNSFCPASGNFYHGYIPGLTSNFSMNAIYLSISTIFLFSEFLNNKKRSSLFFLLISVIGLFVAGKRAHLLFSILCCALLYFFSKKDSKMLNKIVYFSIIGVVGIVALFILSNYIPEIMNVVNRFALLIDEGDLINGRGDLYNLAIMLWQGSMLIGNGWGSFSYNYPKYISNANAAETVDAHNCYIQLLCEVGIIGVIFVALIMIYALKSAYKNLSDETLTQDESLMAKFSFAYQLFFLLYCLTGNPLYDHQCYVVYFIVMGFAIYYRMRSKEKEYEKSRNNDVLQSV